MEEALSAPHTLVVDEFAGAENPGFQIEAVAPDGEFSLERKKGKGAGSLCTVPLSRSMEPPAPYALAKSRPRPPRALSNGAMQA